ncbi:tetraspanin-7-like isoform X2 [Styela clava]
MERFLTRIFTSLCFMFAVTGILVFAFGIFFEVKYGHVIGRVSLDDTGIATPKNVFAASSAISISVGLIIFFVSLCGWHGARDGNICMLKIFKFVLFAVIILYFVLTILTIVAASSLEMTIMQSVEFMFSTYNSNKEPIDHIQQYGECCGVKSYLDWSKNENWVNTVSQLSLNSTAQWCCHHLVALNFQKIPNNSAKRRRYFMKMDVDIKSGSLSMTIQNSSKHLEFSLLLLLSLESL